MATSVRCAAAMRIAVALALGAATAVVVAAPPAAALPPMDAPSATDWPTTQEQQTAWDSLDPARRQVAVDVARIEVIAQTVAQVAAQTPADQPPASGAGSSRTDLGPGTQAIVASELRANKVLGFGTAQDDRDDDALPDAFEDNLAQRFMPEYHVSAGEDSGVGFGRFLDQPTLVSGPVLRQRPPIVHTRVTGVGGRWSSGALYGYVRVDYLTLWNKDSGYVNGAAFPCFAVGLLPGHDNDPERSALLLAAPVANDGGAVRYNPDPNAYRAFYQFTTAHEDFPVTFEDRFLQISPPSAPDDHASPRLYLARSKHGTYPFNPDGHPVIVPEVRITAQAVFLGLQAAGRLAGVIDDALGRLGLPHGPIEEAIIEVAIVYTFEIVLNVCAAEDFAEQGGDVPTDPLNVGEPTHPLPGFAFINDPEIRGKLVGPPTGKAPRGARSCGYTWVAWKTFAVDEYFVGCRGWLIMQSDGNLVLYDEYDVPLWASGTVGYPGATAAFQTDGNLVVYAPGGVPLWASNTGGRAAAGRLVLQDDANLVIYDASGWPVWDRYHGQLPGPPPPPPTGGGGGGGDDPCGPRVRLCTL